MEEKKVKKTKNVSEKKTSKPKAPKKTLASTLTDIDLQANTKVDVKVMFPYLENEEPEDWAKRFPKPAHNGDIGWDLTATELEYDVQHDCYVYHTGFYCETKNDLGCFLMLRSGNAKTDSYLCNQVGLIETFIYRGEFILKFKNRTSMEVRAKLEALECWNTMRWYKKMFTTYNKVLHSIYRNMVECEVDYKLYSPYDIGDKIGQIVWMKPVYDLNVEIVDELSDTTRGTGGFGSTGK